MKKLVLYIAMSLDGYAADSDGGVSWLGGEDPNNMDMGSYPDFIKMVDTVIFGYVVVRVLSISVLKPIL